ncbi:MAG: TetR/AcrR family transcriptional regulator [Alphaproteobacteria bacterium]|nr:TetR/AcrR family transcriptional regulator [Alphaproteobacteria bacterium]
MTIEIKNKKKQILKAAKDIFLSKGFAGAPISKIATDAKVPKALIYHYFKNKDELWKEVKINIFEEYFEDDIISNTPTNNFYDFLSYIISKRIQIYAHNGDLVKIIRWQALEDADKESPLMTTPTSSILEPWHKAIIQFQIIKEIRSDVNPSQALLMIMQAPSSPFLISNHPFGQEDKETQLKSYETMLINVLFDGLKNIVK